jgi:hypothetical protein
LLNKKRGGIGNRFARSTENLSGLSDGLFITRGDAEQSKYTIRQRVRPDPPHLGGKVQQLDCHPQCRMIH